MNESKEKNIIRKVKVGIQVSGNHKHSEMKVKGIKINNKL